MFDCGQAPRGAAPVDPDIGRPIGPAARDRDASVVGDRKGSDPSAECDERLDDAACDVGAEKHVAGVYDHSRQHLAIVARPFDLPEGSVERRCQFFYGAALDISYKGAAAAQIGPTSVRERELKF